MTKKSINKGKETQKKYTFPDLGIVIEAKNLKEAEQKAEKILSKK